MGISNNIYNIYSFNCDDKIQGEKARIKKLIAGKHNIFIKQQSNSKKAIVNC